MLPPSTLKTLFTICIFTAFQLTTVECYECTSCSIGECVFNPSTCKTSKACFSRRQELTTSGVLSGLAQEKGCSSGSCTPLAFSATLGEKYAFSYDHRCCQSKQCNKEDIALSRDSKPNGIECPACFTDDDPICDPDPLKCRGAETKCVVVTGKGTDSSARSRELFGMGCATESACNLDMTVMGAVKIRTKCKATSSGSPALTPITSAMLASLFLLKVLL
ncbi:protein RoBo-1-like [Octodon degus]|uniref:Protein RoBo-1-like n=1 Tax=Octodon degus TaxID=10160 RepID=A0A6P6D9J9_OCTDE|nr:protein RoBo-1-like [Octodon degus]